MMTRSNSLSITGATEDLPFLVLPLSAFLADFFFLGIAGLYLYGCGEDHRSAAGLLVKELTQDIFGFGIYETPFKR